MSMFNPSSAHTHTQGNSHSSVKFDLCTKYITVTAHYTTWQLISDRKDRSLQQQQAQTGAGTTTLSWLTHHTANIYENIKHKYEGSPVTGTVNRTPERRRFQTGVFISCVWTQHTHTFNVCVENRVNTCMDDCSRCLTGAERGGEVVNIIHPWAVRPPKRPAARTLSPLHIHWKQCMRQ